MLLFLVFYSFWLCVKIIMSYENNLEWEERKALLIRALFHDQTRLSPITEDVDNEDIITPEPLRRPETPLPELLIEREPDKHDESEEFYLKLEKKVRLLYKIMFSKIARARTASYTLDIEKPSSKEIGNNSITSIDVNDLNIDVDNENVEDVMDDTVSDNLNEINVDRCTDSLQSHEVSYKDDEGEEDGSSDKANDCEQEVSYVDNESNEEGSSNTIDDCDDDESEVTINNHDPNKSIARESDKNSDSEVTNNQIDSDDENIDNRNEYSVRTKSADGKSNSSPTFTQVTNNKVTETSIHSFREYCSEHSSAGNDDDSADEDEIMDEEEDIVSDVSKDRSDDQDGNENEQSDSSRENSKLEDKSKSVRPLTRSKSLELRKDNKNRRMSLPVKSRRNTTDFDPRRPDAIGIVEKGFAARNLSPKASIDDSNQKETEVTSITSINDEVNTSGAVSTSISEGSKSKETTPSPLPRRSLEIMRRANLNTDHRISLPVTRKRKSTGSCREASPSFSAEVDAMEDSSVAEQILTGSFMERDVEDSNPELSFFLRTSTPEPHPSNEDHSPRKVSKSTSPKEVYWDDVKNDFFIGSVQIFNVCRCKNHVCNDTL